MAESAPLCGAECERPLPYGHACEALCHERACPPCSHHTEARCFCGREQLQGACHLVASDPRLRLRLAPSAAGGGGGGGRGGGGVAASYACLRTLKMGGATAKVSSIAPSADHGHVAVGCRDGSVGTWDIETGARLLAFTGHESAVTCIASGVFDVNGREYLLSGDGDGELHLWDLRTALPICALAQQHDAKLTCCSLFQGKFAFCGSADGSSTVWNLLTGKCVKRVEAHAKGVTCAALHPNNKSVVTGGIDRIVKIWGVQDEVVALV